MSKLQIRIILSVVISLALIAGVYLSVQAASLYQTRAGVGTYVLSGALVKPFQVQTTDAVKPAGELQTYPSSEGMGGGHGNCESEGRVNPEE